MQIIVAVHKKDKRIRPMIFFTNDKVDENTITGLLPEKTDEFWDIQSVHADEIVCATDEQLILTTLRKETPK